jgi:hypothetical protein
MLVTFCRASRSDPFGAGFQPMGCSRLRLIKNTLKSVGIFSMLDVHQKKYLIAGIDLSPDQKQLGSSWIFPA